MGSDPFVAAERLHTRLRLLPLLLGRAEFDEFELTKPTIHLVIDADGRHNWDITRGRVAKQALASSPENAAADTAIGHLVVNGGTILYDDLDHDTREQMTDVDLDVMWPSVSATASGRGKLTWRGEPMEFTALLAAPLQLIRGNTSAARFAIASTPVRASFSGRATGNGGLHLYGDASISTPSLRRTIEWLGTPMGAGAILGAAAVRGTASVGGPTIGFDAATVELDGNSASGSLGVSFAGERPLVRGTLAFDALDLSAYIEAIRADLIASGSWMIAPARLAFAEAVNADLHFTMAQVTMGAILAGKTDAAVTMKDGGLDIAIADADFYSGKVTSHVGLTRSADTLAGTLTAKITGVSARPALTDLAGISALGGTMDAMLDLTARGRSWSEFANTIAGKGTLATKDGTLTGLDLASAANALVDPFAGTISAGDGETTFPLLTAGFTVANGEIATDDLFMVGDDFRLALSGHGSVLNGGVEGRAILTNSTESIPVSLAGTWRQPTLTRAQPGRPRG
jgi:uncharacterized protein involved in outer membrane biogenesis